MFTKCFSIRTLNSDKVISNEWLVTVPRELLDLTSAVM